MSNWVKVASTEEIPVNQHKLIDVDGSDIIVFNVDDNYYALEDVCSHDGSEISSGHVEGGCIVCPRHGAKFDIKTGAVKSAPAYEDIEAFEIKVEDGNIFVKDHRW